MSELHETKRARMPTHTNAANPTTPPAPAEAVSPTQTAATMPTASSARTMWVGFALITGALIGTTAGLLSAVGGIHIALAIVAGGSAAGGTIALFLGLVRFATGDSA